MVAFFSQSSSFLARAPRAVRESAQDNLTIDHIDIPGISSPATTVNRAAAGKRLTNFILSTGDQAVTIDRGKSRQDKRASQDLARND